MIRAESKQSANEGGVRQPIMFSWPGFIQPGNRVDLLYSGIDIMPDSGKECFGAIFAHDLAEIDKPEDTLRYRWVVGGKWKLLLTYDAGSTATPAATRARRSVRSSLSSSPIPMRTRISPRRISRSSNNLPTSRRRGSRSPSVRC